MSKRDADTELAEDAHALTPGRQKCHVLNLNAAKRPATHGARVARFRAKIIAGKGAKQR